MTGDAPALGGADAAAAVAEAKLSLRIDGTGDDALLAVLAGAATAMCEAFTGQILVARAFDQRLPASGAWTRLGRTPVRAITSVALVIGGASPSVLSPGAYALDIDTNGDGWVRYGAGGAYLAHATGAGGRLLVSYQAGLADGWDAVPEALRQGVLRLAGHLYMRGETGDAGGAEPPAAVAALWRPFRRMRLR